MVSGVVPIGAFPQKTLAVQEVNLADGPPDEL